MFRTMYGFFTWVSFDVMGAFLFCVVPYSIGILILPLTFSATTGIFRSPISGHCPANRSGFSDGDFRMATQDPLIGLRFLFQQLCVILHKINNLCDLNESDKTDNSDCSYCKGFIDFLLINDYVIAEKPLVPVQMNGIRTFQVPADFSLPTITLYL